MLIQVGFIVAILSIVFGFMLDGGNIKIIFNSHALMIILGAAFGIFIISNPISLLKAIGHKVVGLFNGKVYSKQSYIDLTVFMYFYFRFLRDKSTIDIEDTIENPKKAEIFNNFPSIKADKEVLVFFCDYTRVLNLNSNQEPYEIENMMENQIAVHRMHTHEIAEAFYKMGETLPALGIVAAVLGMINVMASFNKDPEIIGAKLAIALLGTFVGVTVAYCFANPLGSILEKTGNDEARVFDCIKAGFMAHARGHNPTIAIEFARQAIPTNLKPSFQEIETAIDIKKQLMKKNNGR